MGKYAVSPLMGGCANAAETTPRAVPNVKVIVNHAACFIGSLLGRRGQPALGEPGAELASRKSFLFYFTPNRKSVFPTFGMSIGDEYRNGPLGSDGFDVRILASFCLCC